MLSELKQTQPFATFQQELYLSLVRTVDRLRREVEDFLKAYGITEAQYNVLRILRGAGPEPLSCGDIGARMVTRDPDITRLLDRLEHARFLRRIRDAPDRRVVCVGILPKGLELLEGLDSLVLELHQRQFEWIGSEEGALLLDQLTRTRQLQDARMARRGFTVTVRP